MLKLDEAMKHNWLIRYNYLDGHNQFETLAEGKIYDFIPNVGDHIRLDNITYNVILRTIDFDNSIIWISLYNEKTQNKNQ